MIRQYEFGDVLALGEQKEETPFLQDEDLMEHENITWTYMDGNKVVAIIGVVKMWSGVGQCFAMTRKHYHKGVGYTRGTIRKMDDAMKVMELSRMQTYVRADRPDFRRWAELLGMDCEGLMRKSSPDGGDMYLYARVD